LDWGARESGEIMWVSFGVVERKSNGDICGLRKMGMGDGVEIMPRLSVSGFLRGCDWIDVMTK
jgi:hypothetical protein